MASHRATNTADRNESLSRLYASIKLMVQACQRASPPSVVFTIKIRLRDSSSVNTYSLRNFHAHLTAKLSLVLSGGESIIAVAVMRSNGWRDTGA